MSFKVGNGLLKEYNGKDKVVTIPEGVTVIGYGVFNRCTSIVEAIFPKA